MAQTLARPGWAGSGITTQAWFRHTVLYRLDTRTFARAAGSPETASGSFKGITERLDYIRDLGADAILLEPVDADGATPVDPALGTIDDFDELLQQASRRELRVLLTLPRANPSLARFWLTRGVAGFYIPGTATPAIQSIRQLLPTFVGQRVLLTDADLTATGSERKSPPNELQIDSALLKLPAPPPGTAAAQLREALEQSQQLLRSGSTVLATDAATIPRSASRFAPAGGEAAASRLLAAVLLLNRSVPVLYAGQELGPAGSASMMPWGRDAAPTTEPATEAAAPVTAPVAAPPPVQAPATHTASEGYVPYVPPAKPANPVKAAPPDPASVAGQEADQNSMLSLYRQLIQLHHGRPSVRDGDEILMNHDAVNALVLIRKPANPSLATPPMVVVCNLSGAPLRLSLKSELTGMHLRGSFLRSVLHPGTQSVSMNLDSVNLPAFGVYIGELRY